MLIISVDSSKEMLGTFSPQLEPYTHEMPEEVTPSGMFARGQYTARSKVIYIATKFTQFYGTIITYAFP
jgi:hypothetical protein